MSLNVKKNTILLYVLNISALVMVGIVIICFVNAQKYIAGLMAQGLDLTSQFIEVIHYYCTSTAPYVFYALCLFSLGILVKQFSTHAPNDTSSEANFKNVNAHEEEDTDLVDDLLEELEPDK